MTASIVGWAHTQFGKLEQETVESLIVRVATDAMVDAGIAPGDVDEIVLGHFNAGFSEQDFTASLVLQADPGLRFKPATRVENACAQVQQQCIRPSKQFAPAPHAWCW
jgi:acetyl-CoA C-acetyltransferase